jgi:hypothetical protein
MSDKEIQYLRHILDECIYILLTTRDVLSSSDYRK